MSETIEDKKESVSSLSGSGSISSKYGSIVSYTVENKKFNKKLLAIFVAVLLGSALIFSAVFYFRGGGDGSSMSEVAQVSPTPSPKAVISPTSSSEAEVILSDYSVQVLNGVGTSGVAGKVADLLKKQGFEDIDTGNAENFDYTQTEVRIKKETPQKIAQVIEKTLEADYEVVEGEVLTDKSSYDAVVIVGK